MKPNSLPTSEVEQYDFEDLFITPESAESLQEHSSSDNDNEEGTNIDDSIPLPGITTFNNNTRPVSSLTVGIQKLVICEETSELKNEAQNCKLTEEIDLNSNVKFHDFNQLGYENSDNIDICNFKQPNSLRLGMSAPVNIPNIRPWHHKSKNGIKNRYHDDDHNNNDDDDDGLTRATTFVPPHLLVERPDIQFSLNSGIAQKRATLEARNKIFQMTGFLECETQNNKKWYKELNSRRTDQNMVGGLSKEFSVSSLKTLE